MKPRTYRFYWEGLNSSSRISFTNCRGDQCRVRSLTIGARA